MDSSQLRSGRGIHILQWISGLDTAVHGWKAGKSLSIHTHRDVKQFSFEYGLNVTISSPILSQTLPEACARLNLASFVLI